MDAALTITTVPAVLAIVNLLKGFGLSGKWAALVAVVVAVTLVMGEAYISVELWQNISTALILGLSASGLYDVTQGATRRETIAVDRSAADETVDADAPITERESN